MLVYVRITVNQIVAHTLNNLPRRFWMNSLEGVGQHICCFANNLDILHDSIINHYVFFETLKRNVLHHLFYVLGIFDDVFQSTSIPRFLSHISISCHD